MYGINDVETRLESIESGFDKLEIDDVKDDVTPEIAGAFFDDVESDLNKINDSLCSCDASMKLSEVIHVNQQWSIDYNLLLEENIRLRETEKRLVRLKSEFEELKEMIHLQQLQQQQQQLQQQQQQQQQQQKQPTHNKTQSDEKIEYPPSSKHSHHGDDKNKDGASIATKNDEMKLLREQLKIYEVDFHQEKKQNKKLFSENNVLKTNLQKANEMVQNLTIKNSKIKEKYQYIRSEKDRIMSELKRLTNTKMDSASYSASHHNVRQHRSSPVDHIYHLHGGEKNVMSRSVLPKDTPHVVLPPSSQRHYMNYPRPRYHPSKPP